MALPKRRISKSRKRKRRTHYHLVSPTVGSCPKCLQPVLPHHVCPHCGYYKGREVIEVEEV